MRSCVHHPFRESALMAPSPEAVRLRVEPDDPSPGVAHGLRGPASGATIDGWLPNGLHFLREQVSRDLEWHPEDR